MREEFTCYQSRSVRSIKGSKKIFCTVFKFVFVFLKNMEMVQMRLIEENKLLKQTAEAKVR